MLELLIAMTLVSQDLPRTLPLSEVEQADPLVLAPKVLPAETAAGIRGGWVRRWWVPGQVHRALFWEQSRPEREGICARRVHVVELAERNAPGHQADPATPLAVEQLAEGIQYGPSYPEPASEARCVELTGYIAGPPEQIEAVLMMLTRLTDAMRLAGGSADLPFALECTGEDPEICRDARGALANLPLDQLLNLGVSNTRYTVDNSTPGVQVRMMQPVTDGRWPQATAEFDISPPGARSWTVTLVGTDRLEAIQMRRTTIIRH